MDRLRKRRYSDQMKLRMGGYNVEMANDGDYKFIVEFQGPKERARYPIAVQALSAEKTVSFVRRLCIPYCVSGLYKGGVRKVQVELPDNYPYKPPSVAFVNRIFHPNVDDPSGTIWLNGIDEAWSPLFDLVKVFEVFLPQLLLNPNPLDPLNSDATSLMLEDEMQYDS